MLASSGFHTCFVKKHSSWSWFFPQKRHLKIMQVSKLTAAHQSKDKWESKTEASFFYSLICPPDCQGSWWSQRACPMYPLSHPPHGSILNKRAKGILQQTQTFARGIWEQNRQKEELKVCNRSKVKASLPLPHLNDISWKIY